MIAYKLFRKRKDGSLGSLFINKRARYPLGQQLAAENYPTKGFTVRPGWHCCATKYAPHLSTKNRVWCKIEIEDNAKVHRRPAFQGSWWYCAKFMTILEELPA